MKRSLLFCMAISAMELALATFMFSTLPDRIPIHWDDAGVPDAWRGRISVFLIPTLTLVSVLLLGAFLSYLMRKGEKYRRSRSFFAIALVGEKLVFTALYLAYAIAVLGVKSEIASVDRVTYLACGVVLLVLGVRMPKISMNDRSRTRHSPKSQAAWQKSNRFGGTLLALAGIFFVLSQLVVPPNLNMWLPPCFLALCGVLVWVHSRLFHKRGSESSGKHQDQA